LGNVIKDPNRLG